MSPQPDTVEACDQEQAWLYVPTTIESETATEMIDLRGVRCGCPVDAAELSTAMGRNFMTPEVPAGAPAGLDPTNIQGFGVLGGCVFESAESQVILLLMGTDLEAFRESVAASASVSGFDDAAVYYKRTGQSEFSIRDEDGNLQYGGNDWVLEAVIGPFVHRISVAGNIVEEDGSEGVLSGLRALAEVIIENQAQEPAPEPDDSNAPSSGAGGGGTGGDEPGDGGASSGGSSGGPSSGGGGSAQGAFASLTIDGTEYRFNQAISCQVSSTAIAVQIAGEGLFKADSASGLISVQTQSTLEGTAGVRVVFSLSDATLSDGGFMLTAAATRHANVRDLGDPGSPAGDAVIAVGC